MMFFEAKGPQHKAHLVIDTNVLYLDVRKDSNVIHCMIIDKGNGGGLWENCIAIKEMRY